MKIYKYTSINSALKIIKSNQVLLNKPEKFNDPFDSLMDVSEEEKQRVLDLTINYYTFQIFNNLVNRKDIILKPVEKEYFATFKSQLSIISEMIKKTKEYKYIPTFKDMLSLMSNFDVNKELEIAINDAKDKLYYEIIPDIESIRSKVRISCFSKRNDSILMWSHYADSHKGVCLEFEENRDFFRTVEYSVKRPKLSLYEATARALAFDFLGEKLTYQDKDFADKMLKPIYTKSTDWSYENEVRCILSDIEPNTPGYHFDGENSYIDMKITKLYIGSKADPESIKELLYFAEKRKIPVVYMKEDDDEYLIVPNKNKTFWDGKFVKKI